MKKNLLSLLLFLVLQLSYSQPYSHYLDGTCEWKYYSSGWSINGYYQYDTVYFDGYEVINGVSYYKQYRNSTQTTIWWYGETTSETNLYGPGYVREDPNGSFYYLNTADNTETLYFDNQTILNTQVGDIYPGESCTVQSTQSINLGTTQLKKINGVMAGPTRGSIEGVGYLGLPCGTGFESNYDMQCYTKQGNTIQFGTIDCNSFPPANRQSLSTPSNTLASSIVVYPNPSKGPFKIVAYLDYNEIRYILSNMQGSVVKNGIITSQTQEIDISNFANGVYLLKLEMKDKFYYQKIIKE